MKSTSIMFLVASMPAFRSTAFHVGRLPHRVVASSSPSTSPLVVSRFYHQTGSSRLNLGFLKDLFTPPQMSSQDEIMRVFKDPKTVVIDVRSPPEITTKVDSPNWVNAPGTPFSCELLEKDAEKVVGSDKSTPVIVYCASGKRSQKAADVLTQQGYENVYNAGGIGNMGYLPMRSG